MFRIQHIYEWHEESSMARGHRWWQNFFFVFLFMAAEWMFKKIWNFFKAQIKMNFFLCVCVAYMVYRFPITFVSTFFDCKKNRNNRKRFSSSGIITKVRRVNDRNILSTAKFTLISGNVSSITLAAWQLPPDDRHKYCIL